MSRDPNDNMIPVMQEEIDIGKRLVESRLRLRKRVEHEEQTIDEPLLESSYDIERFEKNVVVTDPPKPRYEGDTLVLPVLEEILVVEKRLILREEFRITPKSKQVRRPKTLSVRREHIDVERIE